MHRMLNSYLREKFGCKVMKLAISGGMTCPTRDGTKGTRGCIFCSGAGSGDFAAHGNSVTEQIERAKSLVAKKAGEGCKYIAYFQDFTNTYAPVSYLERIFTEAMNAPDVVALSIATRPDCLPDDVLSLLSVLNTQKPVWVELGLQTIHERTAEYIRRGYSLSVYDEAVYKLKSIGAEVITHMILCLPGETVDDMMQTAKYISDTGSDGIKLQLLHVLKGTDLALDYEKGLFTLPTLDEYIEILEKVLPMLREDIVIHRLTGDGAKRDLIAPLWTGDKKRVLGAVNKIIRQ